MTAKPEDPNGVYLAQENGGRRADIAFCLRMGCTRWKTVPTPQSVEALDPVNSARLISQRHIKFVSQLSEDVPCGPPAKEKIPALLPPEAHGEVFLRLRCGSPGNFDRDCLNSEAPMPSYVEALQAGQTWAFRAPRFYEVYDKAGGQLLARGMCYK